MLILLALPLIVVIATMQRFVQSYAPSNLLARRVRARQPRWRIVAALVVGAAALLVSVHVLSEAVAAGAPGWLNLFVLVVAWDAIKLGLLAISLSGRCLLRLFKEPLQEVLPSHGSPRVEA